MKKSISVGLLLCLAATNAFAFGSSPSNGQALEGMDCQNLFLKLLKVNDQNSPMSFELDLKGKKPSDNSACGMRVRYSENEHEKGAVNVVAYDSGIWPFNDIPLTGTDATSNWNRNGSPLSWSCEKSGSGISIDYSFQISGGWGPRTYRAILSIHPQTDGDSLIKFSDGYGEDSCVVKVL